MCVLVSARVRACVRAVLCACVLCMLCVRCGVVRAISSCGKPSTRVPCNEIRLLILVQAFKNTVDLVKHLQPVAGCDNTASYKLIL